MMVEMMEMIEMMEVFVVSPDFVVEQTHPLAQRSFDLEVEIDLGVVPALKSNWNQ